MSTSLTPPKLGNKQLDSQPESADKAKKYPEKRNNATPQLFIADDLAKSATHQLLIADSKTGPKMEKRIPSIEAPD